MEQPIIGSGVPQPAPSAKQPFRHSLNFVRDNLGKLGADEHIFLAEPDKEVQRKLYNSLYQLSKRDNLPMTIKFHDDGLRVWKVTQ